MEQTRKTVEISTIQTSTIQLTVKLMSSNATIRHRYVPRFERQRRACKVIIAQALSESGWGVRRLFFICQKLRERFLFQCRGEHSNIYSYFSFWNNYVHFFLLLFFCFTPCFEWFNSLFSCSFLFLDHITSWFSRFLSFKSEIW